MPGVASTLGTMVPSTALEEVDTRAAAASGVVHGKAVAVAMVEVGAAAAGEVVSEDGETVFEQCQNNALSNNLQHFLPSKSTVEDFRNIKNK